MLTCIACSKQLNNNNGSIGRHEEEDTLETQRTRQTIKALTSQIKDIALKASGAYKSCKPCSGSSNNDHCPYRRRGSSNSTPGSWGKEKESRLKGLSCREGNPVSVCGRTESAVFMEEDEPKDWVAQVEPGVLITFVSLPEGGNGLKRIRFSREMFDKWQAQRWWAENYDKVMELYNVQRFNRQAVPLPTPPGSEDKVSRTESAKDSPVTPPLNKECPNNFVRPTGMAICHQIPWIITQCNRANTITRLHLLRHRNSPALVESRLRHHRSMALLGLVHPGRQIDLESSLSVIPVTWKLNGLNRMNQGFTSLLEHFQAALGSLGVSDSAEKGSGKCMQGCGGTKTEPGYKNNTCLYRTVHSLLGVGVNSATPWAQRGACQHPQGLLLTGLSG
ncbi:hypothetical protein V6N13_011261 [Hibiscus sabdariffa]